jgi:succinate dehydrogenase / fumarate reductase, iron-sulfur subunit
MPGVIGFGDVQDLAQRSRGRVASSLSDEVSEGMVVLDAVHKIQAGQAPDLACRWNCKAGKCGSCSAEINGRPRLMCMTD